MTEYISREALIEEIEEEIEAESSFKNGEKLITKGLKIALKDVKKLPAADVQPVKRGKWILKENAILTSECSLCKRSVSMPEAKFYKFCPYCGAKMDGEQV